MKISPEISIMLSDNWYICRPFFFQRSYEIPQVNHAIKPWEYIWQSERRYSITLNPN